MFCLPPEFANKIKTAIKDGNLNPDKLNKMSSTDRRSFLEKIIGKENAQEVNTLFEKKLLLKNQEKAMYDWATSITGINAADKAETLAKIKRTFADRTKRIFDPAENEQFLNEIAADVYSKKFKIGITLEEAQTITELGQDVLRAKEKLGDNFKTATAEESIDFATKERALENYTGRLKTEITKEYLTRLREGGDWHEKARILVDNARISFNFLAENTRTMKTTLDDSFFGRQGRRALFDPRFTKLWLKNFAESFRDIHKVIKAKDAIQARNAILDGAVIDAESRENYRNGRYDAAVEGGGKRGTSLDNKGTVEEAHPTAAPEVIPFLGRFFAAADITYEAAAVRLRTDIADTVYEMAEKMGYDINDNTVVGDLNGFVNSMTGRGSWGKNMGSMSDFVNKTMFSARNAKSNIDELLSIPKSVGAWATGTQTAAKKIAAQNTLYNVAVIGLLMGLTKALWPDDNKDIFNNTSSNFGKLKFGKMTFDLTSGAGSYLVVLAKILKQQTTSATTGITTKLGGAWGSQDGMEVFYGFLENKLSPMASVVRDITRQKTFGGEKPTILNEIINVALPISISNLSEFKQEAIGMRILGSIADAIGFSVNELTPYQTNWEESTGGELQAFKAKIGQAKFKEANDKYNKLYSDWYSSVYKLPTYTVLSDEVKQRLLTKKKTEIRSKVFTEYGFRYVPVKNQPPPKL